MSCCWSKDITISLPKFDNDLAQTLNCYDKIIKTIPENWFHLFVNLKEISLWRCQIVSLNERAFIGQKKVSQLSLKENKIAHLENNTFSPMISLENLDLSYNKLECINDGLFFGLHHLKTLKLHKNLLKAMGAAAFDFEPINVTFYLSASNKEGDEWWKCETLEWMKEMQRSLPLFCQEEERLHVRASMDDLYWVNYEPECNDGDPWEKDRKVYFTTTEAAKSTADTSETSHFSEATAIGTNLKQSEFSEIEIVQ